MPRLRTKLQQLERTIMSHDQAISVSADQSSSQRDALERFDRVVLADVKKAWTEYQSIRDRSAVYRYLHMVFMQVNWWQRKPDEKREALRVVKKDNPNMELPEDEYAAVIMCTADPKKVDRKACSRWSRVLRYAAKYKSEKELLRDFLQRKGGINKCAARYTRRLGRHAEAKARK
jgi:hypothetical protein